VSITTGETLDLFGAGSELPAAPAGPAATLGMPPPRVLALHFPDLPLQRRARDLCAASLPASAGSSRSLRAPGDRRPEPDEDAPVVVLDAGRVRCCDAAARAAGVQPGMTAAEARAACGRARAVQHDAAADRAALRALAEALLLLAPVVEIAPPEGLLLDASAAHLAVGLGPEHAGSARAEEGLAARVLAVVSDMGHAACAAVATGRAPSAALAQHGRAGALRRVPPAETRAALARLPLQALGLAPAVSARLAGLGIADAGALAALPEGTLAHRFGPEGVLAARLARAEDRSPLVPYVPETLPEESLELEAPAEAAEPLLFVLKRLADRVSARLGGRGLGATRLRLTLRLDPRGEERVAVPLAQPTAVVSRWLGPLKEQLFTLRLPAAVIGMKLAAVEVAPVTVEQLAFGDRPEVLAALDGVLARLAVRLGDGAVFAAEPVERHRPEHAYRTVPFAVGARPRRSRAPDAGPPPAEGLERPTRLLPTPEPVVAEGEGGRLTALRVGGRDRAVLAFQGPERLAGEWWAERYDRDYYRVRLEDLGDCWVFRDGGDGRLYLHGFFD